MQLKPEDISKIIKSQIKNYDNKIESSETGTVIMVGDGIVRAYGLEKCMANELVAFPNGEYGMALNLEEDNVAIVLLGSDAGIKEGDTVTQGQIIGVTGNTGISRGAHLHYEITENGVRVNPLDYLPNYIKAW